MNWKRLAVGSILAPCLYFGGLAGLQYYGQARSEKIHTQDRLQQVVLQEANQLHLKKPVYALLTDSGLTCVRYDSMNNCYAIHIRRKHASRCVVRHELFHIKDKAVTKKNSISAILRYLFYEEPRATLYSITSSPAVRQVEK